MALTDKITAIAEAIRSKTGKTDKLTLAQMATEIESISGGGGEMPENYIEYEFGTSGATKAVMHGFDMRVPARMFSGQKYITSIRFHPGVTAIESRAFYDCSRLELTELPESITRISGYAF